MKKHNPQAIQIIKSFVEGNIDVETFRKEFDNNPIIKKSLAYDPLIHNHPTKYMNGNDDNLLNLFEKINWNDICIWSLIHEWLVMFLDRYNYPNKPTKIYQDAVNTRIALVPDWVDLSDDFLEKEILSKLPENISKKQKIKLCREKIKDIFRYDTSPPRWIQDPEWPIKNDKPLVFKKQSKEKKEDERVYYYFYDPETGETETVIQSY